VKRALTLPQLRRSLPLPPAGEGLRVRALALLPTLAFALAACARQADSAVAATAPGFLWGVWHGFIFPVAWVVSLFDADTAVYAVPNNGGWYDFGYFVGIVFIGVGARKTKVVYQDRVIDIKARRIQEPEA
jgi:hypothetical protein